MLDAQVETRPTNTPIPELDNPYHATKTLLLESGFDQEVIDAIPPHFFPLIEQLNSPELNFLSETLDGIKLIFLHREKINQHFQSSPVEPQFTDFATDLALAHLFSDLGKVITPTACKIYSTNLYRSQNPLPLDPKLFDLSRDDLAEIQNLGLDVDRMTIGDLYTLAHVKYLTKEAANATDPRIRTLLIRAGFHHLTQLPLQLSQVSETEMPFIAFLEILDKTQAVSHRRPAHNDPHGISELQHIYTNISTNFPNDQQESWKSIYTQEARLFIDTLWQEDNPTQLSLLNNHFGNQPFFTEY